MNLDLELRVEGVKGETSVVTYKMEAIDVWYEGLETFKRSLPPSLAGYWAEILIGFLVFELLVIVVLALYCLRGKAKGRTVCLIGLSDSGKTLLFLQLKFGSYGPTQNSIVENSQQYEPSGVKNSKAVTLVDIPGSERVRERLFSKYKHSLRGVVLVVDSLNLSAQEHDIAELLYDLLSDSVYNRSKAPLLVACNKQDMALASPCSSIMEALEKQITQLHVSRAAKPSALDGGPTAQKPVEFIRKGKEFRFSDLPSWMGVRFVECSARGQGAEGKEEKAGAQIKEVRDWLDGLCY